MSGSNAFASEINLGLANGQSGTLTMSAGTLTSSMVVGVTGAGVVVQSGGSVTASVELGANVGSTGYYTLSAGTLSGSEIIGGDGTGVFTQTGGFNDTYPTMTIGYTTGSSGTYALSGGSVSAYNLILGVDVNGVNGHVNGLPTGGDGVFIQSAGNVSVTNQLRVAESSFTTSNTTDTYSLSGGTLSVADLELVGVGGTGTFAQSGGLNEFTYGNSADLYLGEPTPGTYTLSGGVLTNQDSAVPFNEYVGYESTGTFVQSGGSNEPTGFPSFQSGSGSLYVGGGGRGNYLLSGGTLGYSNGALTAGFTEYISATGSFTQTGGVNYPEANNGQYNAGLIVDSGGIYTLSGGTLGLQGSEIVGEQSTGTFLQTNGLNRLSPVLGYLAGSTGTYDLTGGTLNAGVLVGDSGTGTMVQSGGTYKGSLSIAAQSGSVGNYTLSGGVFNANGPLTVGSTNSQGTLTISNDTALAKSASNMGQISLLGPSGINTAGDLTMTGNYSQSSAAALSITLGGPDPGADYGVLTSGGTATFSGALDIALSPGYVPIIGQTWVIADAGAIAGGFTSINLPGGGGSFNPNGSFSNGVYTVTYTPTAVIVSLPEPAGMALLAIGAGAMLARRKRIKVRSQKSEGRRQKFRQSDCALPRGRR
jgi:hypothetical protein